GPLESTDEVRRMIAQVVDQIGEAARTKAEEERPKDAEEPNNSDASEPMTASERQARTLPESENAPLRIAEIAAEELHSQVLLQGNKEDDAAQRDVAEDVKNAKQSSHRIHGTALPR